MHLDAAGANTFAIVVELDIGVVGKEGHGDGGIGNFFGDHEAGQALAEGIIVSAGVPDGNFFGFPCFNGADADGFTIV